MMLRDAKAIKAVEGGKRELSMGYSAEVTFADGVTPSGESFDAIMTNFKMNHVAIVDQARGGSELRIGDGAETWGASPVNLEDGKGTRSMTTRTLMVDGLSVELTDKDAQIVQRAIAGLEKQIGDQKTVIDGHKAHIDAKDQEIGTLKADLKKAQDAALKPEDIDRLVADRASLIQDVKAIDSKIEIKGTDADLRRAAVKAKLGDDMIKDASDAEITGMFKAIAKDAKPVDQFREVVRDSGTHADSNDPRALAAKARADRNKALQDGWKTTDSAT